MLPFIASRYIVRVYLVNLNTDSIDDWMSVLQDKFKILRSCFQVYFNQFAAVIF